MVWDVNNFEVDSNYRLHLNDSIANTSTLLTNCNVLSNGNGFLMLSLNFLHLQTTLVKFILRLQQPISTIQMRYMSK